MGNTTSNTSKDIGEYTGGLEDFYESFEGAFEHDEGDNVDIDTGKLGGAIGKNDKGSKGKVPTMDIVMKHFNKKHIKAKEALVREIAKLAKDIGGKKIDVHGDINKIAKRLKEVLPSDENGLKKANDKTIMRICVHMAEAINNFMGKKVIRATKNSNICRDTNDIVRGLVNNLNSEFLVAKADLHNVIANIGYLHTILDDSFTALKGRLAGKEDKLLGQLAQVHEQVIDELGRQKRTLQVIEAGVVSESDKDLISLLKESEMMRNLVKKIKAENSGDLRKLLSLALSSFAGLSASIALVNKALKKIGMTVGEFKSLAKTDKLFKKLNEKVQANMNKLDSRELRSYLDAVNRIKKESFNLKLIKKIGKNEEKEEVMGAASGGIKVSKSVEKANKTIKMLLNVFNQTMIDASAEALEAGKKMSEQIRSGAIKVTEKVRKFGEMIALLPAIDNYNNYVALSGVYKGFEIKFFIESYKARMRSCIDMLKHVCDENKSSKPCSDLLSSLEKINKIVRDYNETFEKGVAFERIPITKQTAKEGGYTHIKPSDVKNVGFNFEELQMYITYATKSSQFLRSLRETSSQRKEVTEGYSEVLAKGIAMEIDICQEEANKVKKAKFATVNDTVNALGITPTDFDIYINAINRTDYTAQKILAGVFAVSDDPTTPGFNVCVHIDDEYHRIPDRCLVDFIISFAKQENTAGSTFLANISSANGDTRKEEAEKFIKKYESKLFKCFVQPHIDYLEAQIKLLQTAEAVDLYLKEFNDAVIKSPMEIRPLLSEIKNAEVISKWFNSASVKELGLFFESASKTAALRDAIVTSTESNNIGAALAAQVNTAALATTFTANNTDPVEKFRILADKEKVKSHLKKSFARNAALKNIISIFTSVGAKIGNKNISSSTHMTAGQIYKNLTEYLIDTSIFLPTVNALVTTAAPVGIQQPKKHMGIYAIKHQNDGGNDLDKVHQMIVQSMTSKVLTTIKLYRMIHNPVQPGTLGYRDPVRTVVGGKSHKRGGAMPKIMPEATELYVRILLYAETLSDIFKHATDAVNPPTINGVGQDPYQDNGTEWISMIPSIGGIFSDLIDVVFSKSKNSTNENGYYSESDMHKIVSACNKIYMHYKSTDDPCVKAIHDLRNEINHRFGILKRDEWRKYEEFEKGVEGDISKFSFDEKNDEVANIQLFESELDKYERKGKSAMYRDEDAFSAIKAKKKDWSKIDIEGHKRLVQSLLNKVETLFIPNREDIAPSENRGRNEKAVDRVEKEWSITKVIEGCKSEIGFARNDEEKYKILSSMMNGSNNKVPSGIDNSYALFHELVVAPLDILRFVKEKLALLARYVPEGRYAAFNVNVANETPGFINDGIDNSAIPVGVANGVNSVPLGDNGSSYIINEATIGDSFRLFAALDIKVNFVARGVETSVFLDFSNLEDKVEKLVVHIKNNLNKFRGILKEDVIKLYEKNNNVTVANNVGFDLFRAQKLLRRLKNKHEDKPATSIDELTTDRNVDLISKNYGDWFSKVSETLDAHTTNARQHKEPRLRLFNYLIYHYETAANRNFVYGIRNSPLFNVVFPARAVARRPAITAKGVFQNAVTDISHADFLFSNILEKLSMKSSTPGVLVYDKLLNTVASGVSSEKISSGGHALLNSIEGLYAFIASAYKVAEKRSNGYSGIIADFEEISEDKVNNMKAFLPFAIAMTKSFIRVCKILRDLYFADDSFNVTGEVIDLTDNDAGARGAAVAENLKRAAPTYTNNVGAALVVAAVDRGNRNFKSTGSLLSVLDEVMIRANEYVKSYKIVYNETGDLAVFGEPRAGYIQSYKAINNHKPLMPLMPVLIKGVLESDISLELNHALRPVYLDSELNRNTYEGFYDMVKYHNESSPSDFNIHIDSAVDTAKSAIELTKCMMGTPVKLPNFDYTTTNNVEHYFPKIVRAPSRLEAVRQLIAVLHRGTTTTDRRELRRNNMIDLNIVPVDINALSREIPLINLYNYSYAYNAILIDMIANMGNSVRYTGGSNISTQKMIQAYYEFASNPLQIKDISSNIGHYDPPKPVETIYNIDTNIELSTDSHFDIKNYEHLGKIIDVNILATRVNLDHYGKFLDFLQITAFKHGNAVPRIDDTPGGNNVTTIDGGDRFKRYSDSRDNILSYQCFTILRHFNMLRGGFNKSWSEVVYTDFGNTIANNHSYKTPLVSNLAVFFDKTNTLPLGHMLLAALQFGATFDRGDDNNAGVGAGAAFRNVVVDFPAAAQRIDICNSSILCAFDEYRDNVKFLSNIENSIGKTIEDRCEKARILIEKAVMMAMCISGGINLYLTFKNLMKDKWQVLPPYFEFGKTGVDNQGLGIAPGGNYPGSQTDVYMAKLATLGAAPATAVYSNHYSPQFRFTNLIYLKDNDALAYYPDAAVAANNNNDVGGATVSTNQIAPQYDAFRTANMDLTPDKFRSICKSYRCYPVANTTAGGYTNRFEGSSLFTSVYHIFKKHLLSIENKFNGDGMSYKSTRILAAILRRIKGIANVGPPRHGIARAPTSYSIPVGLFMLCIMANIPPMRAAGNRTGLTNAAITIDPAGGMLGLPAGVGAPNFSQITLLNDDVVNNFGVTTDADEITHITDAVGDAMENILLTAIGAKNSPTAPPQAVNYIEWDALTDVGAGVPNSETTRINAGFSKKAIDQHATKIIYLGGVDNTNSKYFLAHDASHVSFTDDGPTLKASSQINFTRNFEKNNIMLGNLVKLDEPLLMEDVFGKKDTDNEKYDFEDNNAGVEAAKTVVIMNNTFMMYHRKYYNRNLTIIGVNADASEVRDLNNFAQLNYACMYYLEYKRYKDAHNLAANVSYEILYSLDRNVRIEDCRLCKFASNGVNFTLGRVSQQPLNSTHVALIAPDGNPIVDYHGYIIRKFHLSPTARVARNADVAPFIGRTFAEANKYARAAVTAIVDAVNVFQTHNNRGFDGFVTAAGGDAVQLMDMFYGSTGIDSGAGAMANSGTNNVPVPFCKIPKSIPYATFVEPFHMKKHAIVGGKNRKVGGINRAMLRDLIMNNFSIMGMGAPAFLYDINRTILFAAIKKDNINELEQDELNAAALSNLTQIQINQITDSRINTTIIRHLFNIILCQRHMRLIMSREVTFNNSKVSRDLPILAASMTEMSDRDHSAQLQNQWEYKY